MSWAHLILWFKCRHTRIQRECIHFGLFILIESDVLLVAVHCVWWWCYLLYTLYLWILLSPALRDASLLVLPLPDSFSLEKLKLVFSQYLTEKIFNELLFIVCFSESVLYVSYFVSVGERIPNYAKSNGKRTEKRNENSEFYVQRNTKTVLKITIFTHKKTDKATEKYGAKLTAAKKKTRQK